MLLLQSFYRCCSVVYVNIKQCAACDFYSLCFVISLLQGSVLPEVIERLELFHHEFSSADELFDLLGVAHIFILGKRSPQSVSEIVGSLRILPSKKQQSFVQLHYLCSEWVGHFPKIPLISAKHTSADPLLQPGLFPKRTTIKNTFSFC